MGGREENNWSSEQFVTLTTENDWSIFCMMGEESYMQYFMAFLPIRYFEEVMLPALQQKPRNMAMTFYF